MVQSFLWFLCSQDVASPASSKRPNLSSCQTEVVSVFQTETGGRRGAAVITVMWSPLDQGLELDMNMECTSPWASQPVTLVQDRLTESAWTVSLFQVFQCPLRKESGKGSGGGGVGGGVLLFVLNLTGQKTGSSHDLSPCLMGTPLFLLLSSHLPSSSWKNDLKITMHRCLSALLFPTFGRNVAAHLSSYPCIL